MKIAKLVVATAVALCVAALVHAHDAGEPKHGGVVSTARDLAFELVADADGAMLYVEDHGKPFATAGLGGKLTVLQGKDRTEADLTPAGENRLHAKGVKFGKGAKAIATINAPGQRPIVVRFSSR